MIKLVKARQIHICNNCQQPIQVGENFWRERKWVEYVHTHEFPCKRAETFNELEEYPYFQTKNIKV